MNVKKVLIISSPYFGYQESVGRAFQELGFQVRIETYDEPIHPFKGLLKWRHKFSLDRERLKQKNREKYDLYIRSVYNSYKPDIVFCFNGTILINNTLDYFRIKSKVIIWMYDSILRKNMQQAKNHIDHADAVFCFEEKDVEYYTSICKTSYFLPTACDTEIYYPISNIERDIDILFVGNIYTSPKRIKILQDIAKKYSHLNIKFYGEYKPYFKNPIKWLFREKRNIFINHNIPPAEVNKLYSRTKITLNIHNEQSIFGANPRLFEACGAGAYQICDANPYIESIFQNGEVGLYHNEDEMIALIEDALHNDKSAQAAAAHKIIVEHHTFVERVKTMLSKLML